MNSIEVYAVVEGQTEQTFIRDVLAPYLAGKSIFMAAMLIGKHGHKGGDIRYARMANDIQKLLKQNANTYVTTMLDFFRLEPEWPGKGILNNRITSGASLSAQVKACVLEEETANRFSVEYNGLDAIHRLVPYIMMHEFEAMLFSDTQALAKGTGINKKLLDKIVIDCMEPEEIDDRPQTAPSKRIELLKKGYAKKKIINGVTIAKDIGISHIRSKCPHFDTWVSKLESLAQ